MSSPLRTLLVAVAALSLPALAQDAGLPSQRLVTSAELVALLSGTPPPIVFDVRTGEEFARSHLPGSTLLPWSDPQRFVSELPAEKSQTLVFYCNGPT